MAAANCRLLLEACFLVIMGVFRRRRQRERQRTHVQDFIIEFLSDCFPAVDFLVLVVKTVVYLYFLHKSTKSDCFLNFCVGSHLEKREHTQYILVLLLSLRSRRSLESGFHMIASIAERFFQRP